MEYLRIEKIILYDFALPLRRPYQLSGSVLTAREVLIAQVITDKGVIGLGEAAPLPGLSVEPLKKARHQLEMLAGEWRGREIPLKGLGFIEHCQRSLDRDLVCPSAKFALESAVLMAVARTREEVPCNILQPGAAKAIQSAGLLQGTLPEVVEQARILKAQGVTVFKLKVGNRNIPLDIRKVEEVKAALGPSVSLRLDANRSWRFDEALLFAQNIGRNQIEYFEEPCPQIDKWEELYRRTDIPLAVDESLTQCDLADLAGLDGLACFVVKPMVWGGVTGTLGLIQSAKESGKKVVISSAFESGIGVTMLANLAALSGEVAGLGSFNWLAADTLKDPLMTPSGLVSVPRLSLSPDDLCDQLRGQLVTC